MELDFDKEIDVLLRQTAHGGDFVSNEFAAPHLDADEIAAFAENALPEKTRQNYMRHLADCDRCRKSLSNLIAFSAEAETETIPARAEHFTAAPTAWYQRLFAFPNPAYLMGALILLFSGIALYTVLQSGNSRNAEVSQMSEKQTGGKGMSSDGDAAVVESSANKMTANSAAMNSATLTAMNSNAAIMSQERNKDLKPAPSAAPRNETADLAKTENPVVGSVAPQPPEKENNDLVILGENSRRAQQQSNITQNQVTQNQVQIMPDTRSVQAAPSAAMKAANKDKKLAETKDDAEERSAEAITVGGKIFNRRNNAWYDSAYRGQATTNLTRGTKEYKKLDAKLRGIAENLGGTVIVVWKEKAYRIQ